MKRKKWHKSAKAKAEREEQKVSLDHKSIWNAARMRSISWLLSVCRRPSLLLRNSYFSYCHWLQAHAHSLATEETVLLLRWMRKLPGFYYCSSLCVIGYPVRNRRERSWERTTTEVVGRRCFAAQHRYVHKCARAHTHFPTQFHFQSFPSVHHSALHIQLQLHTHLSQESCPHPVDSMGSKISRLYPFVQIRSRYGFLWFINPFYHGPNDIF